MEKIIAACGNDCAACPRYVKPPYEKTADELRHTAELWMKIGYRDHIVTDEEISCTGCKPENWCRYRVKKCCADKEISTCASCQEYPCDNIRECFEVTKSFEPKCREVCTDEEYRQLKKAFFEKERNLQLQLPAAHQEISKCNAYSSKFGLVLSEAEISGLVASHAEALRASGRIEFGGGILPKLIEAFCDSPYIEQENYADTLAELQEAFYYFKTEAMDRFSDDELIGFMVKVFNGRAQGSAEYLSGTSLEALARYARTGFDPFDAEEAGDLF